MNIIHNKIENRFVFMNSIHIVAFDCFELLVKEQNVILHIRAIFPFKFSNQKMLFFVHL